MNGENIKSDGTPSPTNELLERELAKQEAAKQANSMPLPGALAQAFPVENVRYGKFIVRPMTASDMAVLQKVDSPFCSLATAKPESVTFTAEDMALAVYVFTNPPMVSYNKLKDGKQALLDEAMEKVGAILSPDDLAKMFSAIGTKVPQAFEAAISYGAADKSGEGGEVEVRNFPASNP